MNHRLLRIKLADELFPVVGFMVILTESPNQIESGVIIYARLFCVDNAKTFHTKTLIHMTSLKIRQWF